ncbi:hypothetical protein PERCYII29_5462 [Pseudomonas aeruginosa]|nr:hypothetical protein PERCYII10_5111 [Pseudomonas aeruginosa]VZR94577.1 hypothetical protein PERCYII29_5462 [Pseudomonas aeruginosa]
MVIPLPQLFRKTVRRPVDKLVAVRCGPGTVRVPRGWSFFEQTPRQTRAQLYGQPGTARL